MAGQIIPRGKNVWLVRVFLGRHPQTAKREYLNHTIHGGKKDAQEYLNKTLAERDKGVLSVGQAATIDQLLDMLLLDYKVNGKSYEWVEQTTRKHLRKPFGHVRPSKLTSQMLHAYIAMRQGDGAANTTVNREMALLRRAFYLGKGSSPPIVAVVPTFPMLDENNVRKGFFEYGQYKAIIANMPERTRPVMMFAYFTGCRKGEILSLQWSQVDLIERLVRLNPDETKNDEPRLIPLAPELFDVLTMERSRRDEYFPKAEAVFLDLEGRPISDKKLRTDWDIAVKAAGLDGGDGGPSKSLFHDLRRTGVRDLIRAGVPEKVAMQISAHKTRAVFDRYNIVVEDDLKQAAAKLSEYRKKRADRHDEDQKPPVEGARKPTQ